MEPDGISIGVGDVVAIDYAELFEPGVEAVVYKLTENGFKCISPILQFVHHDGSFKFSELDNVEVVHPARIAVLIETKGTFGINQRVRSKVTQDGDGKPIEGTIVAAYNGHIVVRRDDRINEAGLVKNWESVD